MRLTKLVFGRVRFFLPLACVGFVLVALLPSPLHEVTFQAPAESASSSPATTRLPRGEAATRAFLTAFFLRGSGPSSRKRR